MKSPDTQKHHDGPEPPASPRPRSAFGKWLMQNIEREIRAGRLRETRDEYGHPAPIH